MRRLRRPPVKTEVVPASRFKALMSEDFLDVSHRAAIKQKLCRGGVPEQMRPDRLVEAGNSAVSIKGTPDVRSRQTAPALREEQRRSVVAAHL